MTTLVIAWWRDARFQYESEPSERVGTEVYRTMGELRYEDDEVIEIGHEVSEETGKWRGVTALHKAWIVEQYRVPVPANGEKTDGHQEGTT